MELYNDALKKMRIESNLVQEQMAENMKIPQSTYNRLENGKTKLKMEHIPPIAKALSKSEDEILSKLSGCTIATTNNDTAQYNQNLALNVSDKELLANLISHKDQIIESQKQTIEALNFTVYSEYVAKTFFITRSKIISF